MSELTAADAFIRARLLVAPAVAAGKVYPDEAPQRSVPPYVVMSLQGAATDLAEVGAHRIWSSLLYLVKVIDAGTSYAAIEAMADEIDARLHRSSGPVGLTAYVDACTREQPFRMAETTPGGAEYRHLGGLYRLLVRAL